jgi:ATP-dependent RNA helicase DeaD
VSAVLVAPAGLRRAAALLQRARVKYRIEPIPTAAAIREAQDARWLAELMQGETREVSERVQRQVQRIIEAGLTERALAQLIISARRASGEPREVTPLLPEAPRGRERPGQQRDRFADRRDNAPRERIDRDREPRRERVDRDQDRDQGGQWVPFRVTWGEAHGADARRLVAMLCRRGNIRGSDIGAIRVSRTTSIVEVAAPVAEGFAAATREPDPRDPRVIVTPVSGATGPGPERRERSSPHKPRAHVPPSEHRRVHPAPRAAQHRRPEPAPRAPEHRRPEPAPPRASAERAAEQPPRRPPRKIIVDAPPRRKPKTK